MSSTPIKVLCVDDSPLLTAALGRLFAMQTDMQLVGTLDRANELVAEASTRGADVVVLDLTMDGQDPLQAVRDLSVQAPAIRVIVYSGHSDDASVSQAVEAGAWGYVDKGESPRIMLEAIRSVARGEVVLPKRRHF